MHRWNWGIFWLSAMLFAFGSSGQAQNPNSYQLAVGTAGTDSFVFGTELWAATQINLLPSHNLTIETVVVHSDQERLLRLRDGFFDFALVSDKAKRLYLFDPTTERVQQSFALGYNLRGAYREIEKAEGVAMNPDTDRLYIVSDEEARLYIYQVR